MGTRNILRSLMSLFYVWYILKNLIYFHQSMNPYFCKCLQASASSLVRWFTLSLVPRYLVEVPHKCIYSYWWSGHPFILTSLQACLNARFCVVEPFLAINAISELQVTISLHLVVKLLNIFVKTKLFHE